MLTLILLLPLIGYILRRVKNKRLFSRSDIDYLNI